MFNIGNWLLKKRYKDTKSIFIESYPYKLLDPPPKKKIVH